MKRGHLLLVTALAVFGCTPKVSPDVVSTNAVFAQQSVTIMTFNVENLFDTEDDAGKNDRAYLPRTKKNDPEHIAACEIIEVERWRWECLELDWNEDILDFKLRQIASAILQVNDGRGPDILALQEVENIRILERLSRDYLAAAGYGDAILIEGRDLRGIDVAFLSRLPLAGKSELHPLDLSSFPDRARDTRGVLEATFELPNGGLVTGYSVHFPAPYHPIEMREIAYDHLNRLRAGLPEGRIVFAAGDFNTPSREMSDTTIMDDRVRPLWTVAHEVGCSECKGTNYWVRGESWSFLDMILLSIPEDSYWQVRPDGVFVADRAQGQLNPDGTVKRFSPESLEGISDHLPFLVTLEHIGDKR